MPLNFCLAAGSPAIRGSGRFSLRLEPRVGNTFLLMLKIPFSLQSCSSDGTDQCQSLGLLWRVYVHLILIHHFLVWCCCRGKPAKIHPPSGTTMSTEGLSCTHSFAGRSQHSSGMTRRVVLPEMSGLSHHSLVGIWPSAV